MVYNYIFIPAIFAVFDWFTVAYRSRLEYIAKPGTMLALIFWVLYAINPSKNSFPWGGVFWFVLGGAASTLGDIILMLPGNTFLSGLVSFACAHIAYIVGLTYYGLDFNLAAAITVALVILVGIRVFRHLAGGLRKSQNSNLVGPVLFYVVVISIMVVLALFTLSNNRWQTGPAMLIGLGATSFFVSDTLLGWDRFVSPIQSARLKVMVFYHLGQFGILIGAVAQFLSSGV